MNPFAYIPSPSQNGFYIGPLFFHAYGICYVVAVAVAVYVGRQRWRAQGGDPEMLYEVAKWGFPAGLIGGRLYFVLTTPSQMPQHWWGPFAIWDGGLGIWGGIAAGAGVGIWRLQRVMSKADTSRFMSMLAPSLLIAQAIGRVGNYFNQELFGSPSKLPWALKIAYEHRPPGYTQYATFQPTFLYEIIWDLAAAGFLIWLDARRKVRPPGIFALYVVAYSGFRIFEETIRIDYSKHILGMRVNFWIALILTLLGIIWFLRIQTRPVTPDRPAADTELDQKFEAPTSAPAAAK